MMKTYYVTATHEIMTSVFNPPDGFILAEFPVEETAIPFNPLTILTDGRIEDIQRLDAEGRLKAEEYLSSLTRRS